MSAQPSPESSTQFPVFVYGTLMPGERNATVAAQYSQPTARPASLRGFRLFHLRPENYPGIVPGEPTDRVQGYVLSYGAELWPQVLAALDHLEGLDETPPLYHRERVELEVEGQHETAWVYVYARTERLQAPGVQSIPGGDWRETQAREQHGPDER